LRCIFPEVQFFWGSALSWVQSPTPSATKIQQAGKFTTHRPPSNMHRKTEEATLLFTMGIATFSGASSKTCPPHCCLSFAFRTCSRRFAPFLPAPCEVRRMSSFAQRFMPTEICKNARQAQTPAIQVKNFDLGNLASP